MTDLRQRLDAMAADATDDTRLVSPKGVAPAPRRWRALAVTAAAGTAAVTIAVVLAVGGDDDTVEVIPTDRPTTSAAPSTTIPAEPTGSDLADGTHDVYIKAVDPVARTVSVDVVQFLVGDEALLAAAEDGTQIDGEAYYIRNQNPRIRTLPVAPDAPIILNLLGPGEPADRIPVTLEGLAERMAVVFADYPDADIYPFIFTVEGGRITAIEERYVP